MINLFVIDGQEIRHSYKMAINITVGPAEGCESIPSDTPPFAAFGSSYRSHASEISRLYPHPLIHAFFRAGFELAADENSLHRCGIWQSNAAPDTRISVRFVLSSYSLDPTSLTE